jgi:transcriptional regulator with XRE-family HTH domain
VRLVANWVRLLRGWTQVEMAAAVGLSQSDVSRYEKGLRAADLHQLAEMAGMPIWIVESVLVPSVSIARAFAAVGAADISQDSWSLPDAFVDEADIAAKANIVQFLLRIEQRIPAEVSWTQRFPLCQGERTAKDFSVLVGLLRLLGGCTYEELADRAGIHPRTMSRYKSATSRPDRRMLEKLAAGGRVPLWIVEGILLPAISFVHSAASQRGQEISRSASVESAIAYESDDEAAASLEAFRSSLRQARRRDLDERVAQLCSQSLRAATDDTALAAELAKRALILAESASPISGHENRRQAYAWAFVGNAQRVANALPSSEQCFATAWRLWRSGSPDDNPEGCGLIAEWRLLDLEASLRRDQRFFAVALDLLARAFNSAPDNVRGRLLLSRAYALEQAGEIDRAVDTLQEAAPYVESAGDSNNLWTLRINRLVLLCHLERFREARSGLEYLNALARQRGNRLDVLRARWLTARVLAGIGDTAEAATELTSVRAEFTACGLAFDAALVTLELAILHLEAGRAAEVRALAAEMLWIFKSQEIQREALAALTLFCHAVESATLTVSLARSVFRSLEKSPVRGSRGTVPEMAAGH